MSVRFCELKELSLEELHTLCEKDNLPIGPRLICLSDLLRNTLNKNTTIIFDGFLEINGTWGLLRDINNNFLPCPYDVYISQKMIKDFDLRRGDHIVGEISIRTNDEKKSLHMHKILNVNGLNPPIRRYFFDDLTASYPTEQIMLGNNVDNIKKNHDYNASRFIDLIAPIGFGQRVQITAQPKTGKTTILHAIASSILQNYNDVCLIILMVGERPEEVKEFSKIIEFNKKKYNRTEVDIFFSTFDKSEEEQIRVCEMTIALAKRKVERNKKVVLLIDSLTRLARAYNIVVPSSGKVLSGGVDPLALQKVKRIFGMARNTENGSLTIIATCLRDTGSRADDLIFEEMKGTSNCDIVLSKEIAEKDIFPAINIQSSGTRRSENMMEEHNYFKLKVIKSFLSNMDAIEGTKFLNSRINSTENNQMLINTLQR